jgi:hypothetical protein
MGEARPTRTGLVAEIGPSPTLGVPDLVLWYTTGMRATLEMMRTSLELSRNLNDIGREVVRQAQDEAFAALRRSLAPDATQRPPLESGADLARMGFSAVTQSMAAMTRVFDAAADARQAPGNDDLPMPGRSRPTA